MEYIHPSEFLCDRQSQLNIFCEADAALQASIQQVRIMIYSIFPCCWGISFNIYLYSVYGFSLIVLRRGKIFSQ